MCGVCGAFVGATASWYFPIFPFCWDRRKRCHRSLPSFVFGFSAFFICAAQRCMPVTCWGVTFFLFVSKIEPKVFYFIAQQAKRKCCASLRTFSNKLGRRDGQKWKRHARAQNLTKHYKLNETQREFHGGCKMKPFYFTSLVKKKSTIKPNKNKS